MGGAALLSVSCANNSNSSNNNGGSDAGGSGSGSGSGGGSGVTYIGSKAPGTARAVGDIVYTDGSADASSATLNAAKIGAAVAVIFDAANKKGVGLVEGACKWARYASSEDKATGFASVDGAKSTSDGFANTAAIKALGDWSSDNYPAAYWAYTYTVTGFTTGWYLPASDELTALYNNKSTVAASITKLGSAALNDGEYWSSTQASGGSADKHAYSVNLGNSVLGSPVKSQAEYVRAVRVFN